MFDKLDFFETQYKESLTQKKPDCSIINYNIVN